MVEPLGIRNSSRLAWVGRPMALFTQPPSAATLPLPQETDYDNGVSPTMSQSSGYDNTTLTSLSSRMGGMTVRPLQSTTIKMAMANTPINSTISRDNTAGGGARQADLLAHFGTKLRNRAGGISNFNLSHQSSPKITYPASPLENGGLNIGGATPPTGAEHKHFCQHCQRWLGTKSELNEHELRHNKPFQCDVQGCSRQKRFGTKNDLERHKRSIHSDLAVSGPRYICRLDQCITRDPPKIWPRADNFRSHLRRIHNKELAADADLEDYIYHDVQMSTQDSAPVGSNIQHSPPGNQFLALQYR